MQAPEEQNGKYQQDAEDLLCCPISFEIMTDPVIAPDGKTYNRQSFLDWLNECDRKGLPLTCPESRIELTVIREPNTNKIIDAVGLIPNRILKDIITLHQKTQTQATHASPENKPSAAVSAIVEPSQVEKLQSVKSAIIEEVKPYKWESINTEYTDIPVAYVTNKFIIWDEHHMKMKMQKYVYKDELSLATALSAYESQGCKVNHDPDFSHNSTHYPLTLSVSFEDKNNKQQFTKAHKYFYENSQIRQQRVANSVVAKIPAVVHAQANPRFIKIKKVKLASWEGTNSRYPALPIANVIVMFDRFDLRDKSTKERKIVYKDADSLQKAYKAYLAHGCKVRIDPSFIHDNTHHIHTLSIPQQFDKNIEIYVKYEGLNPTASFKDRGMTVAVTQAVAEGSRAIICASTGNTSAAAAAYAARAAITCFVVIPEGKIALGKLAQAMEHGAVVLQIQGNFDEGLAIVRQLGEATPVTIVNSINPYRLQGQKTAAFEVIEQLGVVPDYHCLPVGNAGNISAYWMGYSEYFNEGIIKTRPKMLGFQATGAAPLIHQKAIANPETIATAIRIGNPASWDLANQAQQESEGWFDHVSDAEILAAQKLLAAQEGIFCEPASAASIAGLLREIERGKIVAGTKVVCTLTGHGLKDPDVAIAQNKDALIPIAADFKVIAKEIEKHL